jgi:ABC-type polar amino acid transport system ATPase subunit
MDEGVIIERGLADDILTNPRTERFQAFLKRYSNVSMRTT